jgi:hypothetical protein
MPLNWKSVDSRHVERAFEKVSTTATRKRATSIIVWHNGQALPAKEVLRVAYRLANNLPEDAAVRFSSGDPTLRLLGQLGFKVERLGVMPTGDKKSSQETTG